MRWKSIESVDASKSGTILIAGYYGFGNAGDEAILSAMLAGLRGRREDLECIVVSGNPTETAAWIKQLAVDGSQVVATLVSIVRKTLSGEVKSQYPGQNFQPAIISDH
jgi:polysaccharide pyruvyl transferase WcaK-like protein